MQPTTQTHASKIEIPPLLSAAVSAQYHGLTAECIVRKENPIRCKLVMCLWVQTAVLSFDARKLYLPRVVTMERTLGSLQQLMFISL